VPAAVYGGYGSAPLPVDDFLATFGARGDRDVSALLPSPCTSTGERAHAAGCAEARLGGALGLLAVRESLGYGPRNTPHLAFLPGDVRVSGRANTEAQPPLYALGRHQLPQRISQSRTPN
jgi:hypothetical protein